jgi:hypothetical protein
MDVTGLGWMSQMARWRYDALSKRRRSSWTAEDQVFWDYAEARKTRIIDGLTDEYRKGQAAEQADSWGDTHPGGSEGAEMENPRR